MPRAYSVRRNATALLAAGLLSASGLATANAAGPPATPDAVAGDATVVFVLHPNDTSALRRVAARRTAGPAERLAALRRAAPDAGTRERVAGWLATHGFTVTGRSPWTVTGTAPAATAAAALGVSATRTGGHLTHRGALRPPAALAGAVDGVVGLDDRPVFRHRSPMPRPAGTLGAEELHDAYDADPAAIGAGTTVATVQFAGWNRTDLSDYATAAGLSGKANPAAVTPYTDTSQRAATYNSATDGDGDFEVALDQESLLATAPQAAQRIYFAQNSLAGFELALTKLLTDIWSGAQVTALSISWGACEQDYAADGDGSQLTAIEQTLENLAAAGVTIFAASGDSGAFDCAQVSADGSSNPAAGQRAVDFPGSSPVVVSVGGTRLLHGDAGWRETAWGPTWPTPGRSVGSGGGWSTRFDRPDWQLGIGGQFTGTTRAVPDIASAADPKAGFGVYQKRLCGVSSWCLGGGTSAGAPAQAGLFVSALAAAGRTAGIGDVHPVLYGNPTLFRDVTAGSNGTFSAGFGWDPTTGLGTPRWRGLTQRLLGAALVAPPAVRTPSVPVYASLPAGASATGWNAQEGTGAACGDGATATAPTSVPLAEGADRSTAVSVAALAGEAGCLTASAGVLLDTVAPTPYARLAPYNGRDARMKLSWGTASDGTVPSWAGRFTIRLRRYRDGAVTWSATRGITGSQVLPVRQGAAYRLEVQETDRAGNTGAWVYSPYVLAPWDGTHFSYGSRWTHTSASEAFGGRIAYTTTSGARMTGQFTGSTLWLVAYTSPSSGSVYVNVDGKYAGTVRLYSRTARWRVLLPAWHGANGTHVVKLTNTGHHAAASTGTYTWIDAIATQ